MKFLRNKDLANQLTTQCYEIDNIYTMEILEMVLPNVHLIDR